MNIGSRDKGFSRPSHLLLSPIMKRRQMMEVRLVPSLYHLVGECFLFTKTF